MFAMLRKHFWLSTTRWVQHLFTIRNKMVGILGLKVSRNVDRNELVKNFNCDKGEQIGLFKVFGKSADEIILGEDDKHLNFRVSLFLERPQIDKRQARLTVSTAVLFNNWFGSQKIANSTLTKFPADKLPETLHPM